MDFEKRRAQGLSRVRKGVDGTRIYCDGEWFLIG
jgi:hypothetical protein